jgi:hypothetical protein
VTRHGSGFYGVRGPHGKPVVAERKAKVREAKVLAACWCGEEQVLVPESWVARGRTRPCWRGHPRCSSTTAGGAR